MQCESQPTATVNESTKSGELNSSPDVPDLVHPTRLTVQLYADQLHDGASSSATAQTVKLHGNSNSYQNNTAQSRSRISPAMTYPPPPPPPISIAEMSVPPPPPMAFSNGSHSSLTSVARRSVSQDKIDSEQQSLRDLRDKLVGARFSVAAKRTQLRNLHIETVAKDGFVFTLLRQYLNEIGADLPRDIEDALTDASLLRDQLGPLEVEYDEVEASYNTLEWRYSRRETNFVEELLNNKLVPSGTLDRSRSTDNLEIQQFTQFMTRPTYDSPTISDLTAYTDETSAKDTTQIHALPTKQDDVFPYGLSSLDKMRDLTLVQSKSANNLHQTHKHLHWVEKMNKIDGWLLDVVDTSPLQKLRLQAMYDFGFGDTRTWWEHTKWLLIQDCSTYFHTGDSTVPSNTIGRQVSGSAKEEPGSVSSVRESSHYQGTRDQAPVHHKLPADPREEATSSSLTSPSLGRCTSHRSIATMSDAPRYIEGEEREQIRWNTVSPILCQRSRLQGPQNRTHLQKRHTVPEFKKAEPVQVAVLPKKPSNTSCSPSNFPRPVSYSNSRKPHRRLSSHTVSTLRQCSESEQSSSLATSNLTLPQAPQTMSPTSRIDRCLVM